MACVPSAVAAVAQNVLGPETFKEDPVWTAKSSPYITKVCVHVCGVCGVCCVRRVCGVCGVRVCGLTK
jgi:hypothetical protein